MQDLQNIYMTTGQSVRYRLGSLTSDHHWKNLTAYPELKMVEGTYCRSDPTIAHYLLCA